MDKSILKNSAIYARNKLIQEIKNKASMLGITEKGIEPPLVESTADMLIFDIKAIEPYKISGKEVNQYKRLVDELNKRKENGDYATAYNGLIEEVAYTWFNRLIAIRFMEVNNYLPDKMRVLSSGRPGVNEPEFVTNYLDTSLKFNDEESDYLYQWKMDGSSQSMDKMFRLLFIKQCNALNKNLPELFEETNDYAELLLTISYNDIEGVLYKLVHDIPEEYFDIDKGNGQVEIIGWLYQYYNTERKDEVFSRPKTEKIKKEDIPAATQLFTPDWIVRYMVENSLGRLWIEKLIADGDKRCEKEIMEGFNWKYYIPEAEQTIDVKEELLNIRKGRKNIELEKIKFIDPAMGSFHIGVYAFEVFMQLYKSQGYRDSQAAELIIEKNLYGLDIDKRAYQLSYFACMMKGRQYNRRILSGEVKCNLYSMHESNKINRKHLDYFGDGLLDKEAKEKAKKNIKEILDIFIDGKEYGSILDIPDKYNFPALKEYITDSRFSNYIPTEIIGIEDTQKEILEILNVAEVLSQKYDIVATNPPYMGSSGMNPKLSEYLRENYPDSKSDLFAVFMEVANSLLKNNGISSLVTMQSWMFLSSYEKFRKKLLKKNTIIQLMHMNNMVMRIAFGTSVTIIQKGSIKKYLGTYHMVKYEDLSLEDIPIVFPKRDNRFKIISQDSFEKIPGMPIAYWASSNLIEAFEKGKPMHSIIDPRQGLATADNNRFLRLWYEVDINKANFNSGCIEDSLNSKAKWFPYNKGGARRQWYGNYDYVVNWENDGEEIRNFRDEKGRVRSRPQNTSFYFREAITWSLITSGGFSIRYRETGSIHDVAGMSAFTDNHSLLLYILGLMSTKISDYVFKILNPTINLQIGDFNNFPVILAKDEQVITLVEDSILIAKDEWNSYEESWDFIKHPLIIDARCTLKESYELWAEKSKQRIEKIKNNEEELNKFFIGLYRLEDSLTANVDLNNITLRDSDLIKDVKSFISYGVGCIFGRYSLDIEGLAFAGGEFKYKYRFENGEWEVNKNGDWIKSSIDIAKDNIIIITDEDYFEDDIVNRFIEFVKIAFGEESLNENLKFIADALGGRDTPKEVIRNYFLKDFFNDHKKIYKNRPIYWLYDSGKENGFKALIYMHRYNNDTTGKLRVDYLHEVQKTYEIIIDNLKYNIANNKNPREVAKLEKRLFKITKQLKECKDYDERIAHIALARIPIDLDDGVKVNYDKVQTDEKGKNLQILAKI